MKPQPRICDACGRQDKKNPVGDCWTCVTRIEGFCLEAKPLIPRGQWVTRLADSEVVWFQFAIFGHGQIRHACSARCAVLVVTAMYTDYKQSPK